MLYIRFLGLITRSLCLLRRDFLTCSKSHGWWAAAGEFKPSAAQCSFPLPALSCCPPKSDGASSLAVSTSPQRSPARTHVGSWSMTDGFVSSSVCVECHGVSSDSWRPFDEGCAHWPVLRALPTPADSGPWLPVWSQPSHSWPSSLPAALCLSSITVCPKGSPSHDVLEVAIVMFASSDVSGLICRRPHMPSFWQPKVSIKPSSNTVFYFFQKIFTYLFLDRGREGDREGEKHSSVASHTPPAGDLAWNTALCPDWESNWWHFGSQTSAQSAEPHQSGPTPYFKWIHFFPISLLYCPTFTSIRKNWEPRGLPSLR